MKDVFKTQAKIMLLSIKTAQKIIARKKMETWKKK